MEEVKNGIIVNIEEGNPARVGSDGNPFDDEVGTAKTTLEIDKAEMECNIDSVSGVRRGGIWSEPKVNRARCLPRLL